MSETEWLATFDCHDINYKKALPTSEVKMVVWSCGKLITEKILDEKLKSQPNPMPRDKFVGFMKDLPESAQQKDIKASLQAFDSKEIGSLSKNELSSMLTGYDDNISREQFDKLVNEHMKPEKEGTSMYQIEDLYQTLTQQPKHFKVSNDAMNARK